MTKKEGGQVAFSIGEGAILQISLATGTVVLSLGYIALIHIVDGNGRILSTEVTPTLLALVKEAPKGHTRLLSLNKFRRCPLLPFLLAPCRLIPQKHLVLVP